MNFIKRKVNGIIRRVSDRLTGSGLMQQENTAEGGSALDPRMAEVMRRCGAEGIVLLENDGTLPLKKTDVVSVFGRCQLDWFYVGYGSGGDVHPEHRVSLMEGLENAGAAVNDELAGIYRKWCAEPKNAADHGWWGHWPYSHPEMPVTEELVRRAAITSDIALVVIGRAAGEDRENRLEPGSYYLTDAEKDMLRLVCGIFRRVVVIMNCGSVMDMSFVREYRISALVYAWQLGQESGNAVADVLTGAEQPGGRLTDTIACRYEDYPSSGCFGNREFNNYEEDIFVGYRYFDTFGVDVLYPFGYGLSYTEFETEFVSANKDDCGIELTVRVKNVGGREGRQVVQAYCMPPDGRLKKPRKVLAGFIKTGTIMPGACEEVRLYIEMRNCASYDDAGVAGFADAFVLEAGRYDIAIGDSSASAQTVYGFEVEKNTLVEKCSDACAPRESFDTKCGPAVASPNLVRDKIIKSLPAEIPYTGDRGIKLADVAAGRHTLAEFVAQLTDAELGDLTRGEGKMNSALGIAGNAGAFGGITPALRGKGVPALITADGPSGVRVKRHASLMPCGTALACSWDTELIEELFALEGAEANAFGVDVLLSPGMNIHRDPLCGRNFEYYSEDPLLCGKIAAAAVRGLQGGGVSACPKHFACNNQEVNRNHNDSRLSRRALREIYLRGFEICVKEGRPQHIMTSYNKINGVWAHYNYELATEILRGDWGYDGNVMTDWWMRRAESPEFPGVKDNAYRVRAQVDVLMPGSITPVQQKYVFDKKMLSTLGKPGGLTRGELQRSAMNVLRFALTRM